MIITVLLDGCAVTTGADSKVLTVLPIGGTVAMGSVCILDTVLTIGGTATVGNSCVRVPASIGCMTAGTSFLMDVLPRPVCSKACDRALEGAATLTGVCWGCTPGPRVVTETTCWAGREECNGAPATRGAASEERSVGTGMTGLVRDIADGLGKTGKEDRGADNLGKGCATVGKMLDEHSA